MREVKKHSYSSRAEEKRDSLQTAVLSLWIGMKPNSFLFILLMYGSRMRRTRAQVFTLSLNFSSDRFWVETEIEVGFQFSPTVNCYNACQNACIQPCSQSSPFTVCQVSPPSHNFLILSSQTACGQSCQSACSYTSPIFPPPSTPSSISIVLPTFSLDCPTECASNCGVACVARLDHSPSPAVSESPK